MAGPKRNRVRTDAKPPVSSSSDRDATVDDTPSASSGAPGPYAAYAQSEQSENAHMREDVSRLSADLAPMHIGNDTPLHQQLHEAATNRIGVHVKDIISTIHRLEGLGLQKQNIALPKIVVLGDQSTGKSSVIEAISGIQTPRSEGTCTRCPLFIRVEPTDDPYANWSARVTLRSDFEWDGKKSTIGHTRRFQGWVQKPETTTIDFATANSHDELKELIERAQLATISPLVPSADFLRPTTAGLENAHRCEFSPNIVCITISGPALPSLSFYDLPGIIGQTETAASQYLVKFVKSLVADYIKDPDALILLTCSLENDVANSTAAGIARDLNATDRCIGVLTKPDRLSRGTRPEGLRAILNSKRFALGHGYFVVRNLAQDQLDGGSTHEEARVQEAQFFQTEEPWATNLRDFQSRFGTFNLQSALSGLLAEQITKKLPTIQEQINVRLQENEELLKQYPEAPTQNVVRIISDILQAFSEHVRKELDGEYSFKGWRHVWKDLQKDFFKDLESLKPTMATRGVADKEIYLATIGSRPGASVEEAISLDDSDAAEDEDAQMSDLPETPSKKRKLEGGTPLPSPLKTPSGRTPSKAVVDSGALAGTTFRHLRVQFQLDEVADHLEEASESRVPGQIEPRVVDAMMIKSLGSWELPLNAFFENFERSLRTFLTTLFKKYFDKYEGSALYTSAAGIVRDMMDIHFNQQRTIMADDSLKDETSGPHIYQDDIFRQEQTAMRQRCAQARYNARYRVYKTERLEYVPKVMSVIEEQRLRKDEKVMAVLNHEPYGIELDAICKVTAYYQLASRRFHNAVCMRIESKFFMQLRTQLRDELENQLGIHDEHHGHQNAVRLLTEQSDRELRRRELVGVRTSLLKGQKILIDLQQKKYGEEATAYTSRTSTENGFSSFDMPTPLHEEMDEA